MDILKKGVKNRKIRKVNYRYLKINYRDLTEWVGEDI